MFVGMAFAQPAQRVVARLPPFLRPFPPCAGMLVPQRFEGGEAFERAAALRPIGGEVGTALVAAVRSENSDTPRAIAAIFSVAIAG